MKKHEIALAILVSMAGALVSGRAHAQATRPAGGALRGPSPGGGKTPDLAAFEEAVEFAPRSPSEKVAFSLDEADLARVRAYAQRRFSQGEIAAAQRVYFVLATLDQWSFDDWFGLGLCYQRLGQHGEALPCFAKAGVIRADDPRAPYLAGMSYQGIGNDEYAVKAYDATLRLCAGQSQHSELERSARARRDALTTSPTRGNT